MNENLHIQILGAIHQVYPYDLNERQKKYLHWLIDRALDIGGFDIPKLVCNYLKIDNTESQKKLKQLLSSLLKME